MIRILDSRGQELNDALAVRYGATEDDWEHASDSKAFVELIDGKLIIHSPVSLTHAGVFDFMYRLLGSHVERHGLGRVLAGLFTMELAAERKFEPDILFVSHATAVSLREDRLLGPADVAIEIASPSTRKYDRTEKRQCYEVGGVREYWIVDPYEKRVRIDRPAGTEVQSEVQDWVESRLCPDFALRAEWLWASPSPDVARCAVETSDR